MHRLRRKLRRLLGQPLFPGPKQAGPDAQRFRLDGEEAVDDWVTYCCQCKRCEVACPYGVNVAEIILQAQIRRQEGRQTELAPFFFTHIHWLGKAASLGAPLVNRLNTWGWFRRLLGRMGFSGYLAFPSYRFRSLENGMRKSLGLFGRRDRKVAFFYGCFLNFNRPDIGRAIRNLLIALGMDVVLPPQTCCGLPALGNYNLAAARRYAESNVRTLTPYVEAGYDIVYACPSCGLTLTHDYPGILDVSGGRKIAENSHNVYDYIADLLEASASALNFGPLRRRVAYHVPCHLRALGIGTPAVKLLDAVPGLEVTILDDACCGLAGSYGFKRKHEKTAQSIGERAARNILGTGADVVTSDCGACRMQLGQMSGLPALDPVELLVLSLKSTGIALNTLSLFRGDAKRLQKRAWTPGSD